MSCPMVGCLVYGFLSGLSGCVSIVTLAAMAFERWAANKSSNIGHEITIYNWDGGWSQRYLVIRRPLNAAKKPTTSNSCWIYVTCLLIWLYAALFAGFPLTGVVHYVPEGYLTSCSFDYLSDDLANQIFVFVFFLAAWVLPLSVIVFCYLAIVRYVIQAKGRFSPKDQQLDQLSTTLENCDHHQPTQQCDPQFTTSKNWMVQ